jgi:hypothetical protein
MILLKMLRLTLLWPCAPHSPIDAELAKIKRNYRRNRPPPTSTEEDEETLLPGQEVIVEEELVERRPSNNKRSRVTSITHKTNVGKPSTSNGISSCQTGISEIASSQPTTKKELSSLRTHRTSTPAKSTALGELRYPLPQVCYDAINECIAQMESKVEPEYRYKVNIGCDYEIPQEDGHPRAEGLMQHFEVILISQSVEYWNINNDSP